MSDRRSNTLLTHKLSLALANMPLPAAAPIKRAGHTRMNLADGIEHTRRSRDRI